MKINKYNRYSYVDLLAAATAPEATQTDVDTLGDWFSNYGDQYWNGEYYEADQYRLYPVFEEVEDDQYEIVRYRLQ